MMKHLIFYFLLFAFSTVCVGQPKYRKAAFPRRSTGLCLYDRSLAYGTTPPTTMQQEITKYNSSHGYTGTSAVSMYCDVSTPTPPTENGITNGNGWYDWDRVFKGTQWSPAFWNLVNQYDIMIVKTGYIETQQMSYGEPWTIPTFKAEWRRIVAKMATRPDKFFVITTNYPAGTDGRGERDQLSNLFCKWAKDTLAAGKDSYGAFPKNVYVLDWFHWIASSVDGYCDPIYATANPGDDHPSNEAVRVVTPRFIKEVYDAAIAYEGTTEVSPGYSPIAETDNNVLQNYPNPFNPITTISYTLKMSTYAKVVVSDLLGRTVFETPYEPQSAGIHSVLMDGSMLSSGTYIYTLQTPSFRVSKTMCLVK
jgi:hypothetical protein